MPKKSSDKSPKQDVKSPSIPYKKWDKKKKPALTAAAKKLLDKGPRPVRKKEESAAPRKDGTKLSKEFFNKKYLSEKELHADAKGVFSAEQKYSEDIRLNKYLAHAGVASRRAADELIKAGRVTVNGVVVTEMGHKVKPKDKVEFDGRLLSLEKKYYILLNKPKDFITTVNDERDRKTVMHLLRGAYAQIKSIRKPRLYPVGRLDRNTTGVLLITNDGELAQKLTHPSSEVKKVYHVLLDKKLRKEDFNKIAEGGVVLEDGIAEVDEIAYPNPKNAAEVGVEIHTGKNRFIRRLFESLGYEILKLDRVFFSGLTKKDLPRGRWRFLSEEEVRRLQHFS